MKKMMAMLLASVMAAGTFTTTAYDCGSFVVNGTAVVGKEPQKPYNRCKSTQKGAELYEISI